MKHAYRTAAVCLALGAAACGAKNDLSADQAADALQALVETKFIYDARAPGAAQVACTEGGQVQGVEKRDEPYRAEHNLETMLRLEGCKHRGIIMEGFIRQAQQDHGAQTRRNLRHDGAVFLRGHLEASCDIHLVEPLGLSAETSTFCGYDVLALWEILQARKPGVQPQTDSAPTPAAAPSEAPASDHVDEAPVDEVPIDEAPIDEMPVDEAMIDEAPIDAAPADAGVPRP